MTTQLIIILFVGFAAIMAFLEGFICARKALKQSDKVMAVAAVVFIFCGVVLLLCLNSIKA